MDDGQRSKICRREDTESIPVTTAHLSLCLRAPALLRAALLACTHNKGAPSKHRISPNYGLMPLIMPPLQPLSLPHRQTLLGQCSPLPAPAPGGPPIRHNHHLQLCKDSCLWTGGISTPERAQKVTTDCQSTCGHLWHADAIFLQFFSGKLRDRAQH